MICEIVTLWSVCNNTKSEKVRGGVYTCAHQGTSRQVALSEDGERHAPSHQHDYLQ